MEISNDCRKRWIKNDYKTGILNGREGERKRGRESEGGGGGGLKIEKKQNQKVGRKEITENNVKRDRKPKQIFKMLFFKQLQISLLEFVNFRC